MAAVVMGVVSTDAGAQCRAVALPAPGNRVSRGVAINRAGQIAGAIETDWSASGASIADPSGRWRAIGGAGSVARDIDDGGRVIGQSSTAADGETLHAWLWADGQKRDLGA